MFFTTFNQGSDNFDSLNSLENWGVRRVQSKIFMEQIRKKDQKFFAKPITREGDLKFFKGNLKNFVFSRKFLVFKENILFFKEKHYFFIKAIFSFFL